MKRFLLLFLFILLLAASPEAFASIGEHFRSVHFNSGEPDFGTIPRRASLDWRGEYDIRPARRSGFMGGYYGEVDNTEFAWEYERQEKRDKKRLRLRQEALAMEQRGNWNETAHLLRLEGDTYGWNGTLRDHWEVVSTVAKQGKPLAPDAEERLRRYLSALTLLEQDCRSREAHEAFRVLHNHTEAGFLREHALYQLASIAYALDSFPEALSIYRMVPNQFPKGQKEEAALIMIARCGILPAGATLRNLPAAEAALQLLTKRYPKSRFLGAAKGLQARVDLLRRRYVQAANAYLALNDLASVEAVVKAMPNAQREVLLPRLLAAYLNDLECADTRQKYYWAVTSISRTLERLSTKGAKIFVRLLFEEPSLAAPYFYYRLYHCEEGSQYWESDTEKRRYLKRIAAQRANLGRLADRIAARFPNALPPLVQARLGEVYYQQGIFTSALLWSERALQSSRPGQRANDRALYTRAAARHKQKRYQEAIADYSSLLAQSINKPLRVGAREELAICHERTGNLAAALDEYFALDYAEDIAYLLDVRMTTVQVADYVTSRPRHNKRNLLLYSLGMRLLRDDDLAAARTALRQVPAKAYFTFSKGRREYESEDDTPDPLTVIDRLVALRTAIHTAKTRSERARATFAHASFHYKNGTLLFYNAALWDGGRQIMFNWYWNSHETTPADQERTRQHMYQHESHNRTLRLCEAVARDFPGTDEAAQALYRAACCYDRLARFNPWWRDENRRVELERKAILLMRRVHREYPHHSLSSHARKYEMVFFEEWQQQKKNDRKYGTESAFNGGRGW